MENSSQNDENRLASPVHNVMQNEKRKPLESPFSAFSPAQRLAKKKGRILCEPGDANLEASLMDESVLETEQSDTFPFPKEYKPKVLFAEGDGDIVSNILSDNSPLDHSIVDVTQTDGDRTFSAETRPYVPASFDPNLDETYAETSMNQTFSNEVRPILPSSIDPNLDETLAELTMNETFSNVVRPLVPSTVDPNLDETLADTTINQTQLSMGDETVLAGEEDQTDDADRTLGETECEVNENGSMPSLLDELNGKCGDSRVEEEPTESVVEASIENGGGGGVSLFEEINTIELTVPVDLRMKDEEEKEEEGDEKEEMEMEKSTVEASQENSLMKEGGMSLFQELNTQSSQEWMDEVKEKSEGDMLMDQSAMEGEEADDSPLDESVLSTMTAMGITCEEERRRYYSKMKERLSQINCSFIPRTPKDTKNEKNEEENESTPKLSDTMLTSPASDPRTCQRFSLSNTILDSPSTPSKPSSRYGAMNESHISFIMLEAECTNNVYKELKKDMEVLQEELSKSREVTEKVERERDIAKKEVEDYMFLMEETKKRLMKEKTNLTKQILDLETELTDARRMSSVVEEEARKVEKIEMMKTQLEEQKKELEEKMKDENEKYAEEKERLSTRADEMERQIEEERKKANEEMERRLMECREEMERKMEEILAQKNEMIGRMEKIECESGEKEYTNEENERRLEGENAMLEALMENVVKDKKEIEMQLERVKMEKEETTRQMTELGMEFEGMKNVIGEMEQLRNAVFEESRHANELNGEVEGLKRVNEEMRRGMEEKDKEIVSLRSTITANVVVEGRMEEMEEKVREMEREKREMEMIMKGIKMENDMTGKMESRMEEMMSGLMKKTDDHFKETSALKEEIIELKKRIMENEMEMKAKEMEVGSIEEKRKGIEGEMEKMREEGRMKMESMETLYNGLKMELEEMKKELNAVNEKKMGLEQKIGEMEEDRMRRMKNIEEEQEKESMQKMIEMDNLRDEITRLNEGNGRMEEELEKKKMEIEMMMRAMDSEKEKACAASQSEETVRMMELQMEETNERLAHAQSTLMKMNGEKEEMERRVMEESAQKEEIMRMMEEMKKENEEMMERMEGMKKELEMERSSSSQTNDVVRKMEMELESERSEKKMIALRLTEVESEKEEAMKTIEAERERNDVLSATVKQLEDEVNQEPIVASPSSGFDEKEKKKMEEELKDEKENGLKLKKEVERLEKMCDEFDEIEWKLNEELAARQNKIDHLEGRRQEGGPALLDALKPTTTEIKSMDETVVDQRQSSPAREVAGKDEKEEKEDEEMKEYGTPSGSMMEDEDREMPDGGEGEGGEGRGDETLGVTKIDATKYEVDEEDYEKANQTRPNASCRQS